MGYVVELIVFVLALKKKNKSLTRNLIYWLCAMRKYLTFFFKFNLVFFRNKILGEVSKTAFIIYLFTYLFIIKIKRTERFC